MKRIRAACLLLTLVVLMAQPVVRAEAYCCNDFSTWCAGFCYDHGGVLLCDSWYGPYCSDLCYCADTTHYQDNSGLCDPCS
jgi:hypothetical protein